MADDPVVRRVLLKHLSNVLIGIGTVLLLLVAGYYAYSVYAQSRLQSLQAGEIVSSLPTAEATPSVTQTIVPAEEPASILPGTEAIAAKPPGPMPPATRIVISSIGVDAKVVELGTKLEKGELVWETPDHAVGHHKGTANPGEEGNMVLSGHISSPLRKEGNVFARLPDIAVGALVTIYTDEAQYDYEVKSKRVVLPSEVSVMDPTPDETLTMITCVPDWVYTHRLIVTAKPVG